MAGECGHSRTQGCTIAAHRQVVGLDQRELYSALVDLLRLTGDRRPKLGDLCVYGVRLAEVYHRYIIFIARVEDKRQIAGWVLLRSIPGIGCLKVVDVKTDELDQYGVLR